MSTYQASASLEIEAPATRVYAIISDYREGHPRILPRPPRTNRCGRRKMVSASSTR